MPNEPPGRRLLVTRPARQAESLAEALRKAGHEPVLLPLIAIEPRQFPAPDLAPGDLLIVVSPNAASHGLARLLPLPAGVTVATVGKGTAREVRRLLGREPDVCPRARFDSEGLLAEPALQAVAGRRVFIVRGVGGREALAEGLAARGAEVHHLETYARVPLPAAAELDRLLAGAALDAVLATSGEIIDRLVAETPPPRHPALLTLPLLVIHPRQAERAREHGFRRIISATDGSDGAIIDALERMDIPA